MKRALITAIIGQDGSYLAELLLQKGYEVHGFKRRSSSLNTDRVDHLYQDFHEAGARLFLHYADLTDGSSLARLLYDIEPAEIYNLGAQSHVKVSFEVPEFTMDTVAGGPLRLLEAIRQTGLKCRVFHPRSPYACAKLFGHAVTVNYRESYGLHASCGILFNHESPRRGETFVARKITRAVARIRLGLERKLYLGNLAARRDWGYAPDYVRAMWHMLQQYAPGDYVIGTGEAHSVQEFCEAAFACAGLDWRGHVEVDPRYFRPAEVDHLLADPSKASQVLGWEPEVRFNELVKIMVDADLSLLQRQLAGGPAALKPEAAFV